MRNIKNDGQVISTNKTASNFRLYQLTSDLEVSIEKFLAGEITNEDLQEVQGVFEDKAINVARYILNLEAEHAAVKKAADDMMKRAKSLALHAENLKGYLTINIESTGLTDPIKCSEFTIKLQNNPPSLVIDNSEIIPDVYKKVEEVITFDKNAIKKDILDGFAVEGARVESKKRLVIQ